MWPCLWLVAFQTLGTIKCVIIYDIYTSLDWTIIWINNIHKHFLFVVHLLQKSRREVTFVEVIVVEIEGNSYLSVLASQTNTWETNRAKPSLPGPNFDYIVQIHFKYQATLLIIIQQSNHVIFCEALELM